MWMDRSLPLCVTLCSCITIFFLPLYLYFSAHLSLFFSPCIHFFLPLYPTFSSPLSLFVSPSISLFVSASISICLPLSLPVYRWGQAGAFPPLIVAQLVKYFSWKVGVVLSIGRGREGGGGCGRGWRRGGQRIREGTENKREDRE